MLLTEWEYRREFLELCDLFGISYPENVGQSRLDVRSSNACASISRNWDVAFHWPFCQFIGENLFVAFRDRVLRHAEWGELDNFSANCREEGFRVPWGL